MSSRWTVPSAIFSRIAWPTSCSLKYTRAPSKCLYPTSMAVFTASQAVPLGVCQKKHSSSTLSTMTCQKGTLSSKGGMWLSGLDLCNCGQKVASLNVHITGGPVTKAPLPQKLQGWQIIGLIQHLDPNLCSRLYVCLLLKGGHDRICKQKNSNQSVQMANSSY